jgi:hypothetical protein
MKTFNRSLLLLIKLPSHHIAWMSVSWMHETNKALKSLALTKNFTHIFLDLDSRGSDEREKEDFGDQCVILLLHKSTTDDLLVQWKFFIRIWMLDGAQSLERIPNRKDTHELCTIVKLLHGREMETHCDVDTRNFIPTFCQMTAKL